MAGPSHLKHNRGHAREIQTNGSNISTARCNLVSMSRIRIYSLNKYLMSSYCVHSPMLAVGKPWWAWTDMIPSSSSWEWKDQHPIRPRSVQTNVKLELRETPARREKQCSEIQSSMIRLLPQIREILWKRDVQFRIWGMAPVSINWCIKHVKLFASPWTVGSQAPLSIGFFRQEYWSGLPFSSPGCLPDPWIEPGSPVFLELQVDSLSIGTWVHQLSQ